MFNCKKLFKLQIRPPSLILLITTSQDRWIFPSQSWELRNSMMMMMMIIIPRTGEWNMCYVEAKGSTSDPDSNIIYGINSKVTITKSNNTYPAHQYVLGSACPFFAGQLRLQTHTHWIFNTYCFSTVPVLTRTWPNLVTFEEAHFPDSMICTRGCNYSFMYSWWLARWTPETCTVI